VEREEAEEDLCVEDEVVEGEHQEAEVDSVLVEEVAEEEAVSLEVEVVASRLEVEEVRGEALPGVVDDSYLLLYL
jgi:hypothetical protein